MADQLQSAIIAAPASSPRAPSVGAVVRSLLDGAIALYAASFLAVLILGGYDLGIIRATTAAKPALMLLVLVPVRLAFGGESWAAARLRAMAPAVPVVRVPAAVQDAAFAFAITRLGGLAIAFIANVLIYGGRPEPLGIALPWERLTETLTVFDSAWYIDIARRGYFFDPDAQSSIAFLPLYPLLIWAVARPFGGSDAALWGAGIAVSWLAFGGALVALHRLTERMTGSRDAARRTVLLIAIFPFSFYFSQVYTESLFLLWTVLAVDAAHQSRWVRAGLFGALAAATRSNGILIALPLLIMAARGWPALGRLAPRVLALVPIPLALIGYSAYVYSLTGDPLAWLGAQAQWGFSIGSQPYAHLLRVFESIEADGLYAWLVSSPTAPIDLAYVVVALMFLMLVPAVTRTFGAALGAYVLVALLLPLSANVLVGVGRYASVLFPVFMLAGLVSSPRLQQAVVIVSALFHTLFLILFVGWYPVQ